MFTFSNYNWKATLLLEGQELLTVAFCQCQHQAHLRSCTKSKNMGEQFSTCVTNINLWCVITHTLTITLFTLDYKPVSDGEGGSLSSRSSAEDMVPVEGVLGSLRLKSPVKWTHIHTHMRYFRPAEHFFHPVHWELGQPLYKQNLQTCFNQQYSFSKELLLNLNTYIKLNN